MPWFCRTLPQEVSEDIEVRLCSNEGISNEEIYVELLEGTCMSSELRNIQELVCRNSVRTGTYIVQ